MQTKLLYAAESNVKMPFMNGNVALINAAENFIQDEYP